MNETENSVSQNKDKAEKRENVLLTPEAARELVGRPISLPEQFKKVFGADVEKLAIDTFGDPLLREIDAMVLAGDISREEVGDYVSVLPEYVQIFQNMSLLRQKMSNTLASKAHYYLEQSFRGIDRKGAFEAGKSRVFQVIELITKARSAICVQLNSPLHRNGLILGLEQDVISLFIYTLYKADSSGKYEELISAVAEDYVDSVWSGQVEEELFHRSLKIMTTYDKVYAVIPEDLKKKLPKEEIARLRVASDKMMQEVQELSYLRKADGVVKETDAFKIKFLLPSAGLSPVERAITVAYVQLEAKALPEIRFVLQLTRLTGELCIQTNRIPISVIFGESLYERMRKDTIETVLDVLKSREDDYSWLPARSTEIQRENLETPKVIQVSLPEEDTSSTDLREKWRADAKKDALLYIEEQIALKKTAALDRPVTDGGGGTEQKIAESNADIIRTLRATSSVDIIAALTRILGKPLRQTGSHVIFNGRTNVSYPIPDHGNQPVHIGILKNGCKVLGVLPSEIKNALKKGG